jgi:predicted DNA-binding protein
MISDKNTRTLITLPKELKIKLEELSKLENRSLNNYIITILMKHLENK